MPTDQSENFISKINIDNTIYNIRDVSIPFGEVDSTSTSTKFTATIPAITALQDGICVLLKNGVVSSASNFTLNINNLGAKPVYSNMAATTRETTIFNVDYTMFFIYDSTRISGGCWVCYRGYYPETVVVSTTTPAADSGAKLWFDLSDGVY